MDRNLQNVETLSQHLYSIPGKHGPELVSSQCEITQNTNSVHSTPFKSPFSIETHFNIETAKQYVRLHRLLIFCLHFLTNKYVGLFVNDHGIEKKT